MNRRKRERLNQDLKEAVLHGARVNVCEEWIKEETKDLKTWAIVFAVFMCLFFIGIMVLAESCGSIADQYNEKWLGMYHELGQDFCDTVEGGKLIDIKKGSNGGVMIVCENYARAYPGGG